jgi:hypothetical protein
MNVIEELGLELRETQVQRAPGRAGLVRRGEVVREQPDVLEVPAVIVVLLLHHAHGGGGAGAVAGDDHREKHLLFLREVIEHRRLHGFEQGAQPARA